MTNIDLYRKALAGTLKLSDAELCRLETQEKGCWDSFSQMNLIAALEEAFSIECDLDDMADFISYRAGLDILRRHSVEL